VDVANGPLSRPVKGREPEPEKTVVVVVVVVAQGPQNWLPSGYENTEQ